jgi:hypothetical protein
VATIKSIILAHDRYVTASVGGFKTRLDELVATASARTLAELNRRLAVDAKGNVLATPANQRVLRSVDKLFADAMDEAGYPALANAYVAQFPGQLPYLDEILAQFSDALAEPLPSVKAALTAEDRRALAAQQASAAENLTTVVDTVAAAAKRQALFGFAGVPLADLSETLGRAWSKTARQAETLADTAQTVFYRTVSDRTFQVIERDFPKLDLRYVYEGPLDKITRRYCIAMLARTNKTPLTRAEINDYPNGELPNPFVTCGGWNCRHQYVVSLN